MPEVNVTPFEIETTSRHGDVVRADVYLPKGAAKPLPVLLGASPYQKALRRLPASPQFPFVEYGPMQLYLDEGYAYVAMDVPGTGRSGGKWDPVSRAEGEAIHDMIEHVAAQEWSSGDVGMVGMSYYCWSQWNAARTRPPHLRTIAAFEGATDMYRDWMYHGGIPIQGFLNSWLFGSVLLQHQAAGHDIRGGGRGDVICDMYDHPLDDEWQRRRSPFWELDRVDIPVLSIGAWGKAALHLRGNFTGFERVSGPKRLLVTGADSFAAAQLQYSDAEFHRREVLPWYDHHLKGVANGVMERPKVRFFVQGEGIVSEAPDWPPPDASIAEFFLCGEKSGAVNSLNDGSLVESGKSDGGATSWSYPDPHWMAGVTVIGKDGMPDHFARVLTFTTARFERDREFTGQGVLHLFVSSDQTDADVVVKLSLLPEGDGKPRFIKISQGWLRASHRAEDPTLKTEMRPFHLHQKAEPIETGQIYELRVELLPMSVLVRRGERLRLEISNWESTITEAPMTHWYGQKVGTDTYRHEAAHPCCASTNVHERQLWATVNTTKHKRRNKMSIALPTIPPDNPKRDLTLAQADNLPHIGLVGDTYTITVTGEQTDGRFCVIDMHIPPDGGPPPHRHDFEETFILLEGEMEATFRGKKSIVRAGDTLNIPANAPHQFHNASAKQVRMLCICSPAGQEKFFIEVGVPVATRTTPPPKLNEKEHAAFIERAKALAPKYRTELLKKA